MDVTTGHSIYQDRAFYGKVSLFHAATVFTTVILSSVKSASHSKGCSPAPSGGNRPYGTGLYWQGDDGWSVFAVNSQFCRSVTRQSPTYPDRIPLADLSELHNICQVFLPRRRCKSFGARVRKIFIAILRSIRQRKTDEESLPNRKLIDQYCKKLCWFWYFIE